MGAAESARRDDAARAEPEPVSASGPRRTRGEDARLDREAAELMADFCRNERPEVFRQLFDRAGPRLAPLLRLLVQQHRSPYDPTELLTDTFVQVFRARHTYLQRADGTGFVPWCTTIALNLVRQRHREEQRRGRREQRVARSVHDHSQDPYVHLVREESIVQARAECQVLRRLAFRGLSTLSAKGQQVMLLHLVHRMKYRDIADQLGISTGAVAMRVKRSREKILQFVAEHWQPSDHVFDGTDREERRTS